MRSLPCFLLGACALTIAVAAERLIAPFYGLGPFLDSSLRAIAFLALAIGWFAGTRPRRADRSPGPAPMYIAAVWTLVIPWLRTPALHALEGFGLRTATIVAVVLFAGVPLALIATAVAESSHDGDALAADRGPTAGAALAAALCGAAVFAPLVTWVLVPRLGVSRTVMLAGVVVALAAMLAGGRTRVRSAGAVVIACLAIAALSASRFPAAASDPKHGLIDVREGTALQYRVVDLEDGRYVLADGGLETLVSGATGDPQLRPTAALNIVDLFVAPPESMLVLGLRGGAMAKSFARRGWRVRVAEPDPLATEIATRHLSFSTDEVPTEIQDPRVACRRIAGRFPVVIVDAFAAGPIPYPLTTREFFATAKQRLTGNGVLALAIASGSWRDPLIGSLAATLRTSFRSVIAMPTSEPPNTLGSIVLLASDRTLDLPDGRLPQPTDYFMNLEAHWAVVQMNHAWFNRFEPDAAGAVVLTDDRAPIDAWTDRIQRASRLDLHELFRKSATGW